MGRGATPSRSDSLTGATPQLGCASWPETVWSTRAIFTSFSQRGRPRTAMRPLSIQRGHPKRTVSASSYSMCPRSSILPGGNWTRGETRSSCRRALLPSPGGSTSVPGGRCDTTPPLMNNATPTARLNDSAHSSGAWRATTPRRSNCATQSAKRAIARLRRLGRRAPGLSKTILSSAHNVDKPSFCAKVVTRAQTKRWTVVEL